MLCFHSNFDGLAFHHFHFAQDEKKRSEPSHRLPFVSGCYKQAHLLPDGKRMILLDEQGGGVSCAGIWDSKPCRLPRADSTTCSSRRIMRLPSGRRCACLYSQRRTATGDWARIAFLILGEVKMVESQAIEVAVKAEHLSSVVDRARVVMPQIQSTSFFRFTSTRNVAFCWKAAKQTWFA